MVNTGNNRRSAKVVKTRGNRVLVKKYQYKRVALKKNVKDLPKYKGKVDPRLASLIYEEKPKASSPSSRKYLEYYRDILEEKGSLNSNPSSGSSLRTYWNNLLKIAQWLHFGKDYRTYIAYEKSILNPRTGNDELSKTLAPYGDLDAMRTLHLKLSVDKKRPASYYKYLYFDHIFPGSKRVPTQDIDLQALDLALAWSRDTNIPIDIDKLIHFFESDVVDVLNKKDLYNSSINASVVEIRNRIPDEDWKTIRDVYIEFKMKGLMPAKAIFDTVLNMISRDFTRSELTSWYQSITPVTKFSALKLGALFLNIFHNCYTAACRESKIVIPGQEDVHNIIKLDNKQSENVINPAKKVNYYYNSYHYKTKHLRYNKKAVNEKPKSIRSTTSSTKASSKNQPKIVITRQLNRIKYDKRIPKSLKDEFKNHMFV